MQAANRLIELAREKGLPVIYVENVGTTMTLTPSGNGIITTGASIQVGLCGDGTVRPTLTSISVTGGSASCSTTPLTGGTQRCGSDVQGNVGPYTWSLWSNGSNACMTTYNAGAAFKVTWNNSGDTLARVGLQWDRTKTYDQLGTISADYSYIKSGNAGAYSYIGAYGWSADPCVEFSSSMT